MKRPSLDHIIAELVMMGVVTLREVKSVYSEGELRLLWKEACRALRQTL